MSQYNTGTVSVTNGSAVVTGASTAFSANVTAGDMFTVVGDNAFYTVGSIDSDTQLTLAANYAGVTGSARPYTLVTDFTTNLGFPVPNQGDIETALVVKRAIEEIDSELNTAGIGGDGREWIDLKHTPSFINATQFTIATDKTANYQVNRRLRCSDATVLYGRISASSFAAGQTTVTVALDSGSLTASLSAVALGIAGATTAAITGDGVKGGTPLVDTIDEYTAGAGVTIDSVRLKDQRVENLLDPVNSSDAATKSYVDSAIAVGVYWKQPVRMATTADISLSGEQTIDGVSSSADRILVKDQTAGAENGLYVTSSGSWTRAADADTDTEMVAGIAVYVTQGSNNGDKAYTLTTDDPITLGTTALTFAQFSGSGGGVTAVSGAAPVTSSGGSTPQIGIDAATTSTAGSMSSGDKTKIDGIEASADVTDEVNVRTALAALTADASLNSRKITSLADPTSAQDAATKAYVDAQSSGGSVDWKDSVRVATTANITLSSQQTIDGIFVTTGTRVLVKDQTTGSENGIYLSSTGAWSRATDADADAEVTAGLAVTVTEGTVGADTQWLLTTDDTITLGTTSLTFEQFTGGSGVTVVTGSAPITSSGGNTPDIGISAATTSAAGSMSAADKTKLDGVASSANNYSHPNHSGDVTSAGDGAQTIAANAVTLTKMADMATTSFIGRNSASTGDPEVLSAATARSILNVENGSTADQSNAEIKTAYEANADTNAFTDAEQTTLSGIEASADVTDAANVATAGAVMDSDISAGEGFLRKTGAGAYEAIKSNLSATVAPGATDDGAAGYAVGSRWMDVTADKEYACLDSINSAAVWKETTVTGAWKLIGTRYASVNGQLTITGLEDTAFSMFAIGLSDMKAAADGVGAWIRYGDSGGIDVGATDYSWQYSANNGAAAAISTGASEIQLTPNSGANSVGVGTGEGFSALLYLKRPSDGVLRPMISGTSQWLNTSTALFTGHCGGCRNALITLDRVQFLFSSGNITTGRMTVWGLTHA